MDEELLELQRQFEFAQQAKSKVRLSERNVVELIQKLHELQIIDYDLLHTVSGKEYITPDQLKHEIEVEVRKSGRVSLIDLSDTIGMDLYHVERLSHQVVMEDSGLMLTQGEIISQTYWDNIAEEINERLQECSQISLAELASQLQVGSELLTTVLETRLGSIVKGRFESGQLYTPLYVARVNAMVRGAARGITVPTNLTMLWSSLQQILQETNGGSGISAEGGFFQSLFNGLLKEGEILGSLRAGVHWTPSVFAHAQRECVDSFFSQNSFITYDILQRLAIPQPRQHLEFRYPKGIPLVTVFIHPSIIEMLDAAVEDAIKHNSWIDCLSVLPTSFGSQDVSKLLSYCPAVQKSIKSSLAIILGESFVFSSNFLKDLFDYLEKELEGFYLASTSSQGSHEDMNLIVPVGHNTSSKVVRPESIDDGNSDKTSLQKNSKKRREKLLESSKVAAENYIDKEEFQTKIKKNLKKVSDKKASSKKGNSKINEENPQDIDEEWIVQKILIRSSDLGDFAGQDNSNALLDQLVAHVRPMLLNKWKERKNKLFVENSEKRRKLLDNLQRKLDEAFFNLQLHEKALDLFEDDPSISFILHKHVLRNTASSIVDLLIKNLDTHNKLMNGVEVTESEELESTLLNPTDRMSLAKNFPISLSKKVTSCVEALEGKRVDSFINSLKDLADESGLILRKLDKKLERTLLHSFRKELISRVSTETDPTLLLPLVVSLFYLKVHNKILQAPGRAISVAISRLKGKLDDSVYEVLANYHTLTVSLLSLLASGTHDEEGCTTDKIQSKRELLESEMSKLKDLVFGS